MSSHSLEHELAVLGIIACMLLAATIMGWYLTLRPALTPSTKLILFFGIAVFPIISAMGTNVVGYEVTQTREFCSSCHVMLPYTNDSDDIGSTTLASRHARNEMFGNNNCYGCHSDYGLYGLVLTKMTGMKHLWIYSTRAYDWTDQQAFDRIRLYHPFRNTSCTHCHSTTTPYFSSVRDHLGAREALDAGTVSCASGGCHGPVHPFSKRKLEVAP